MWGKRTTFFFFLPTIKKKFNRKEEINDSEENKREIADQSPDFSSFVP